MNKKQIKSDISLIEAVKLILSKVEYNYDADFITELDGMIQDLCQLKQVNKESKKIRKNEKAN